MRNILFFAILIHEIKLAVRYARLDTRPVKILTKFPSPAEKYGICRLITNGGMQAVDLVQDRSISSLPFPAVCDDCSE